MAHSDSLAIRQLTAENALLEAENRALRERLQQANRRLAAIREALRLAAGHTQH